MDFAFSDEQDEFRAMLRRFLEERWSVAEVRKLAETPAGFDRATWKQMASELGLQGLAIPEAHGGQGFGFLELGIALEEMGRQLSGGPFLASAVLAAQAVQCAGSAAEQAEWLPGLAAGEAIATLAVLEASGRHGAGEVEATCARSGGGWTVSGRKVAVLDAPNADWFVVAAREPGSRGEAGVTLLAVRADAAGVAVKASDGLDLTRKLGTLELDAAPATLIGDAGAGAAPLARTLDLAAIALAAECTGAAARCLEAAVAYAQGRIQFGRPIGAFQAIKHKAAEVMLELETARSAAYWSWWTAAQQGVAAGDLADAASVAKSCCNEAFSRAAAENVHIHGGIGFTWEFDCHLYFRRAKAAELLFGDPLWHRARIADRLGF
ncbi:MAG: acyl-CoA dehydrogenase [Proteobacteria bacterium]|nr:MAG: acyl-CoA dehydrogenase [Pseudomonadota bacterium]